MGLEQIGSILGKMTVEHSLSRVSNLRTAEDEHIFTKEEREQGVFSNDPRTMIFNPPAPALCEHCGEPRYTMGFFIGSKLFWMPTGPERCTCLGAVAVWEKTEAERRKKEEVERKAEEDRQHRERTRKIIGQSGMGERFLRRTFETFQVNEENQNAFRTAKRYIETFDLLLPSREVSEPGRNGLFIAGPPGTGKTHLAAAIANHMIGQGRPVICMTMIDLLERIKRTYSGGEVDEGEVLKIYKTVQLLVIDDIGKEPPTEWAISTIYNIINGRYEAYMPTIITTNYNTEALISRMTPRETKDNTTAKATIDRLWEMCLGLTLSGSSWRLK